MYFFPVKWSDGCSYEAMCSCSQMQSAWALGNGLNTTTLTADGEERALLQPA